MNFRLDFPRDWETGNQRGNQKIKRAAELLESIKKGAQNH